MFLQLLFADPGNSLQRWDIRVSGQGILNERIEIFAGYFIGRGNSDRRLNRTPRLVAKSACMAEGLSCAVCLDSSRTR